MFSLIIFFSMTHFLLPSATAHSSSNWLNRDEWCIFNTIVHPTDLYSGFFSILSSMMFCLLKDYIPDQMCHSEKWEHNLDTIYLVLFTQSHKSIHFFQMSCYLGGNYPNASKSATAIAVEMIMIMNKLIKLNNHQLMLIKDLSLAIIPANEVATISRSHWKRSTKYHSF